MVLKELVSHLEKSKISDLSYKKSWIFIHVLITNVKCKILKLLKENNGEQLSDLEVMKVLLNNTEK